MKRDAISERFHVASKLEGVRSKRAEGWRRHIVARAFNAGVSIDLPRVASWAMLKTIKADSRPSASQNDIWILSKEGLVEDSLAALEGVSWAASYDFPRMCLKLLAERTLPKFLDDNIYASSDPEVREAKRTLRESWRRILSALPPNRRPAAVVTSNFGYFVEREFAGACEAEAIPFIAIHKECFKAPGRLRFFASTYPRRGPFTGRRILVYNNYERDLLVTSGIASASALTVTGMPRLDRVHAWRRAGGLDRDRQRPLTVLAFAFTSATALPRIPRKERTGVTSGLDPLEPEFTGLSWDNLFKGYHEAVVRIACNNPDIRVVLKTKARERDGRPALEFVQSLHPPENLEIAIGGDPLPLLIASDAVIGFNTTGLCEAIAAGLPVVVPDFAEAVSGPTADYVADLKEAVFHAGTAEELAKLTVRLARDRTARWPNLEADRESILHEWMANADGQAGLRVAEAIRSECIHRVAETVGSKTTP